MYIYIGKFLDQFSNLKTLRPFIYKDFEFISPNSSILDAYDILEEFLEDDMNFEKFNDRYGDRFR